MMIRSLDYVYFLKKLIFKLGSGIQLFIVKRYLMHMYFLVYIWFPSFIFVDRFNLFHFYSFDIYFLCLFFKLNELFILKNSNYLQFIYYLYSRISPIIVWSARLISPRQLIWKCITRRLHARGEEWCVCGGGCVCGVWCVRVWGRGEIGDVMVCSSSVCV